MVAFNRLALLEATKCAVEAFDKAADMELAKRQAEYDEAIVAWNDKYQAAWLDALPELRKKLKNGEPLTRSDMPKSRDRYVNEPALFFDTEPRRRQVHIPAQLQNLRAILTTLDEDTVTTGGLQACGIPPSALREALSCMVPQEESK